MNEERNSLEDKFMHEMHLRQHGFRHSTCGLFPRNKKILKNVKEQETSLREKCPNSELFLLRSFGHSD